MLFPVINSNVNIIPTLSPMQKSTNTKANRKILLICFRSIFFPLHINRSAKEHAIVVNTDIHNIVYEYHVLLGRKLDNSLFLFSVFVWLRNILKKLSTTINSPVLNESDTQRIIPTFNANLVD